MKVEIKVLLRNKTKGTNDSEMYLETSRTSMMELLAKIVNNLAVN